MHYLCLNNKLKYTYIYLAKHHHPILTDLRQLSMMFYSDRLVRGMKFWPMEAAYPITMEVRSLGCL